MINNFLQAQTNYVILFPIDSTDVLSKESQGFCKAIERHLNQSGEVSRFLAHLVFVGLPGSGKSTLIARLLKLKKVEEMLKGCGSTGVMDGIITVDIACDKASHYAADIDASMKCDWQEAQFGLSCLRQLGIVLKNAAVKKKIQKSSPDASQSEPTLQEDQADNSKLSDTKVNPAVKEPVQDIMSNIKELLRKEGFSAVLPFLENKTSLYISDTGMYIFIRLLGRVPMHLVDLKSKKMLSCNPKGV